MIVSRLANTLRRGLARPVIKNEDGVTAIEFAMIAPVFFMLMGSLMETGLMMFGEYVLQSSVQDAARLVLTGQAQSASMSAGTFKTEICNRAVVIPDCESRVTVHLVAGDNFSTLNVPSILNVGSSYANGGGDGAAFDCGGPEKAMALIATFDWDFVTPLLADHFGNV